MAGRSRRAPARSRGRAIRLALRERQRHGHGARRDPPCLRSLLHDEADRAGDRAWPLHDLRFRPAVRRAGADLFGGRAGDDGLSLSAAPPRLGRGRGGGGRGGGAAARRAEQGETLLIVDDEPTVQMLVADVLEEFGYYAIEAPDGATGLRIMQSDVRIDLLVTDVGLPGGMNGRQMADAGRVTRPDLKVLFITGYAENAVISHGHLEPGMHLLSKPFTMEMLASRIRDLISTA